jgi:hypothetical protein
MDITLPDRRQRSIAADGDEILLPALVQWRDAKLKDLCYVLSVFFNYLVEPRDGFSLVESKLTNLTSIHPVITREMTNYVLGDIFPCLSMIKEDKFAVFKVPQELDNAIKRLIKDGITNKSLLRGGNKEEQEGFVIEPGVAQTIWTYLSNGVDALAYDSISNDEVAEKIALAEAMTLAKRNCSKNYGFNDDAENCAFQTILYLIVALLDWLELDEVTDIEVLTVYKIIIPQDLQVKLTKTENKRFSEIIIQALVSKDLIPSASAVNLVSTMMTDVGRHINNLKDKNSQRIMSRYLGLAQPV